MIDDVPPVVPPLVATTQATTPSPDVTPPGEGKMPPPTLEQAQAADHVFTDKVQQHPIASILGIAAGFGLLRDVAVDTFDTTGADEEDEPEEDEEPKA